MSRILVTGAAGFIGSHLVEHLVHAGHEVFATDLRPRPALLAPANWKSCDLRDRPAVIGLLQACRPAVVFHLGARTDLEETKDIRKYDANIGGVANIADAIAEVGCVERAVCTSSQLVCRIGYQPTNDQDYQPSTVYGESKVETERIWRSRNGGGVTWCIVRPTTIWGPRMNPHYLRFFGLIRQGRYLHLGGGPRRKSYGYVGNTVRQFSSLLSAPACELNGRVLYLADYEPLVLEAWADEFARVFRAPRIRTIPLAIAQLGAMVGDAINILGAKAFPFNTFRLNNVLAEYRADTRPIQRFCPDLPFTMEDGVQETAEWVRQVWLERGTQMADSLASS